MTKRMTQNDQEDTGDLQEQQDVLPSVKSSVGEELVPILNNLVTEL